MVHVPETDWRKDLGLPEDPTDEQIEDALQALREWCVRENELQDERYRERERIRSRYQRLSRKERERRQAEFEAAMPPWFIYNDEPAGNEYQRRRYVLLLRLHPDANDEDINEARRERIRRHLAAKLGKDDGTPLSELADIVQKELHNLLLQLEASRKTVAVLLGVNDPKPNPDDELASLLAGWGAISMAMTQRARSLSALKRGLPEVWGDHQRPGDSSLSNFEYTLEEAGELPRLKDRSPLR